MNKRFKWFKTSLYILLLIILKVIIGNGDDDDVQAKVLCYTCNTLFLLGRLARYRPHPLFCFVTGIAEMSHAESMAEQLMQVGNTSFF